MSNPNTDLAKWLLQTAFRYKEGEFARYEKHSQSHSARLHFSIDIMPLDSYEKFIS